MARIDPAFGSDAYLRLPAPGPDEVRDASARVHRGRKALRAVARANRDLLASHAAATRGDHFAATLKRADARAALADFPELSATIID